MILQRLNRFLLHELINSFPWKTVPLFDMPVIACTFLAQRSEFYMYAAAR
jgi:hypothetical protein